MRIGALCVLAAGLLPLLGISARQSSFKGWKTLQLSNGVVTAQVAPQIGGRVIGFALGGHQFLWSNPQLAGTTPPPSGLSAKGEWLNYGGEKLWPAPQGWGSDSEWPGPPDPVLDGSPHQAAVITVNGTEAIQLTSRKDPLTGIQFQRTIRLEPQAAHVEFHATMTNVDTKPRRWGIWSVAQLDASDHRGNLNPRFFTYIPLKKSGSGHSPYRVLFGDKNNPEFSVDEDRSLARVHFQWNVGKIGVDSPDGWIANVDGASGYVFVQEFTYEPSKPYPDGSSVELWTNGLGKIKAWGREVTMSADPRENPLVVESEVLSPLAELKPGQSFSFHYDWFAANVGKNLPILDCNKVGCKCTGSEAVVSGNAIRLKGHFGVFYNGKLMADFLDASGKVLGQPREVMQVSPLQPLILDAARLLDRRLAPAGSKRISLYVVNPDGRRVGELDQLPIRE